MHIGSNINNIFMGGSSGILRLYKFNLSNNTFTNVNNNNWAPTFLTTINNINFFYSSDSIYKFISNETYQFITKIPSQILLNNSGGGSIGNNYFITDYIYNYLTNIFTPRVNYFPFSKGNILGNQIYTNNSFADTSDFYFREFTTDMSNVNFPNSELFSFNINYLWGVENGIIFTVEKPKLYYYHKKL
jgi:hypothetical protein